MRIGSLFAGIGGFDLAAQWMGWETKWYSEIDAYAAGIMAQRFPEARNVGDITTWQPVADAAGQQWGKSSSGNGRQVSANDAVDIICGGFPCQPVSVAGKGLAQEDERWLWPHFARVIRILRPRYVVVENVPGLLPRGMGDVLGDLAGIGYDCEWESIPAAAVGAPHLRWRVWIVAYPAGTGNGSDRHGRKTETRSSKLLARGYGCGDGRPWAVESDVCGMADGLPEGLHSHWEREWEGVPRVATGVPDRVNRLKCLGNAIVPQIAYWIFQQIEAREQ